METTRMLAIMILVFGVIGLAVEICAAEPMGTAFSYQGRLIDPCGPADGQYDFEFALFDDANVIDGNQVGSTIGMDDVEVIDSYFTVELDFGDDPNLFNGDAYWLELAVRQGDSNDVNDFVALSPRQKITPTPYAMYAKKPPADNDWMVDGNDMYAIPYGNVGIGTKNPAGKLEVEQSESADAIRVENDGTEAGIRILQNGNGLPLHVVNNGTGTTVSIEQQRADRINTGVLSVRSKACHYGPIAPLAYFLMEDPNTDQHALYVHNKGRGSGLCIRQDGESWPGKSALQVASYDTLQDFPLVTFAQYNESSHQGILNIDNYGNGPSIIVDGGNVGIGTTSPGSKLEVVQNSDEPAIRINKTGAGGGLDIDNDGVGYGLHVRQNGHVSGIFLEQEGNSTALSIHKKGTGYHQGLNIRNDGIGKGIYIQQEGQGEGLYIDQNANSNAQVIGNCGTASGLLIHQGGELGAGESALLVGSDTPQTISPLVNIIQDHPSSTFAPLWIHNDGTGHDIDEKEHGAYLHDGHWVDGCSIANKENFEEMDRANVLSKVEKLSVRQFNMKGSTDKHISATAEDFHATFSLGDGKGISAGDVASIALLCIQELKRENEVLKEKIQVLERTVQKQQSVNLEEVKE